MIDVIERKLPPCPYEGCDGEGHLLFPDDNLMFCGKCLRTYSWFGHYTRMFSFPGKGVWIGNIRGAEKRLEEDYGHNPERDSWAKMMEVPGE